MTGDRGVACAQEGNVWTAHRLLCALFGHRPGPEVYCYASICPEVAQWPHSRGETRIELAGRECDRCQRMIERPAP